MHGRELPAITHLQFLVLGVLLAGEESGRAIREVIASYGLRRSGPAFYQMMARMERDGIVQGSYEQIIVGDQAVTERRYRITPAGAQQWKKACAFYETAKIAAAREGWSNA
ncbi:MAG: helix-turn-helix transcriptional regulator [Acidobacteriota bacterium]|nr:helix-turn-helix transcriptional regulator [Acidobacteriota bacterium]